MANYDAREIEISAADTKTAVTRLGSDGAAGNIQIPAGRSRISKLIVAFAADTTFTVAIAAIVFIRLEGNALPDGPETMVVAGYGQGGITAVANTTRADPPVIIPVDFRVTPGNQLQMFAEMTGDLGIANICIGLEFS
mgnify:CR=1 FL=1